MTAGVTTNGIISKELPTAVYDAIRRVSDTELVTQAFQEAQLAAITRFCEAIEQQAVTGCMPEIALADAYWHIKDQLDSEAQTLANTHAN